MGNGRVFMLAEREQKILAAVIEQHIATAEPVSSHQLCSRYGFTWSSATVRNVLARLEAEGFLNHPYTSAGKVPTVKAYRFFVEHLLKEQTSRDHSQSQLRLEILQQARDTDKRVRLTAKVLAVTTQLLAVTWLPGGWEERLSKIQLIRLAPHRLLVVVHTLSGDEFHQVFSLDEKTDLHLLVEVNQWVNRHANGKTALELNQLAQSHWPGMDQKMRDLLQQALHWVSMNLSASAGEEWVIEGTSNLIRQPEFDNISATRHLVSILDQREELMRTFAAPGIESQGVRVVIADDSTQQWCPALSMVTEEVRLNALTTVRIGVIGPRRMAYDVIIPLVKDTAEALTKASIRH